MEKMARKIQRETTILCVLIALLVLVGCYWVFIYIDTTNKEITSLKEQNRCYTTLYNEDIIGKGCDEYFKNDSWYIEYKNLEKVEK